MAHRVIQRHRGRCVAALLVMVVASSCAPARDTLAQDPRGRDAAEGCAVPPDTAAGVGEARIAPGMYVLTLVAADGSGQPARASGPLVLRPTSAQDRSPTGRRPDAIDDPNLDYLYGATSLDFTRVEASVMRIGGDTITPLSTSLDPVRPGVLVSARGPETMLLIGTLGNLRDDHNRLDGTGIGLRVRRIAPDTVTGVWEGWGAIVGRSGYFCVVRTAARE